MTNAAELEMKERESQEHPKEQDAPWEKPGGVIAYRGEPTAEEVRKLRWQLTPAEKKVVDFVMDKQIDYLRDMTPEQSAKRVKKIQALLDKDTD